MHRNLDTFSFLLVLFLTLSLLVGCGYQVSTVFSNISSGLDTTGGSSAPASESSSGASRTWEEYDEAPAAAAPPQTNKDPETMPTGSEQAAGAAPSLKAGNIDDNDAFPAYLNYLEDNARTRNVLSVDISERYLLRVIDQNQVGVYDAKVRIYDQQQLLFEGLTYAGGWMIFHPRALDVSDNAQAFRIVAEYDNSSGEATLTRGASDEATEIILNSSVAPATIALDVLFLLDATGSMDDEISRVQDTITSIAERVQSLQSRPELRFGLVAYRDHGDEYVTRSSAFTHDLPDFRKALLQVRAAGGGDTPEALNEGLESAINDMDWSERAVRLTFLIADAPPHIEGTNAQQYPKSLLQAQTKGIKIYSIAASNTNQAAEYVMRQIAQQTMASFIFLTYQEGMSEGRSGESTELAAGDAPQGYSVERLDDLIVNIIEEELQNAAVPKPR
jgi:Mg-chelatase subunit ChlD